MPGLAQIFEDIMARNRWSGGESRSGPGSTLAYTVNLRHQLEVFLAAFEIGALFDAPCGDFNWMKEVNFPPGVAYLGGEIAGSLVALTAFRRPTSGSAATAYSTSPTRRSSRRCGASAPRRSAT